MDTVCLENGYIPGSLGHECDAYMSAFTSFGFESKTTVHAAPASGWYHVWCGGCSGTAVESLLSHVGQDALRSPCGIECSLAHCSDV